VTPARIIAVIAWPTVGRRMQKRLGVNPLPLREHYAGRGDRDQCASGKKACNLQKFHID
jgi:hypothetical protein